MACTPGEGGAACRPATTLPEGLTTLSATVKDRAGNISAPAEVRFTVDTIPPTIRLTAPVDGLLTNRPSQAVKGEVSEAATLTVRLNGHAVETLALAGALPFTAAPITLTEGPNTLELVAIDRAGNVGRTSATLTLDTIPPAAVVLAALTVGEVIDGQATISGAKGSAEPGARVTITNLRTGASVTVVAGPDGRFTATIAAQPGDPLRITVTDGAGNTSDPTAANVPAVRVTITEPAAGATVAAGDLLVRGSVEGGGAEVGVTVDGVVAAVHGGTFVALVPVLPRATGLTAVATTAAGVTAQHAVTLTVVEQPGPEVLLTVSPPAGVAPLTAAFSLAGEAAAGPVRVDFDGNGTVDFTGPTLEGQTFAYGAPGLYLPTVTLTDTQGRTRTATAIVQVYDPASLEPLLQGKWATMKEALRRGDVPAALTFVAERSRARYQAAFTALAPQRPASTMCRLPGGRRPASTTS